MDFNEVSEKLVEIINKYNRMLVYIKGSPDPDVIASSFALKILCSYYGKQLSIIALAPVSLPQNQALINKLSIPISFLSHLPDLSDYDAYVVLDHQSSFIDEIGSSLPCALHMDHHEKAETIIKPDLQILSDKVGSVSTIFTHVLKILNIQIDKQVMKNLATALTYGIQTDTNNLQIAQTVDTEAIEYLKLFFDNDALDRISKIPFSEETLTILSKAMINQVRYQNWLISGVGFLQESFRDSIAIVADFLLENENASTVIIYAAIEKENGGIHIDTSLRTKNIDFDLNNFIKRITPNGGARHFKGAYQINLDYFSEFSDKNLLWKVIQESTFKKIKREKNNIMFEHINLFAKVKNTVSHFFRSN